MWKKTGEVFLEQEKERRGAWGMTVWKCGKTKGFCFWELLVSHEIN